VLLSAFAVRSAAGFGAGLIDIPMLAFSRASGAKSPGGSLPLFSYIK
jgi:hypothetical protein